MRLPPVTLALALVSALIPLSARAQTSSSSASFSPNKVYPRIIDGVNTPAAQFAAVTPVFLGQDSLCTGTLISPQYVLTAAHCFYSEHGSRQIGDTDVEVVFNNVAYQSMKVFINPTYVGSSEACSVDREFDAAIVKLSTKIASVVPVPIFPSVVPVGATVTLVGYGEQGTGSVGENDSLPADGTVNFGNAIINDEDNTYLGWTFRSGESNTASGDSGGPAFYTVNGVRYLGAITCGGTGNAQFGTFSVDTRADALLPWINSIVGITPKVTVSSAQLQYISSKNPKNVLGLVGTVAVPTGFAPSGRAVKLQIGSYIGRFRLDRNGNSPRGSDFFSLSGGLRNGIFLNSTITFKATLRSSALFQAISKLGFRVAAHSSTGQAIALPVTVTIDAHSAKTKTMLEFQRSARNWHKVE